MMPPDKSAAAILRLQSPDAELIDSVWMNMPSAYEADTEDKEAALRLLRGILRTLLKER